MHLAEDDHGITTRIGTALQRAKHASRIQLERCEDRRPGGVQSHAIRVRAGHDDDQSARANVALLLLRVPDLCLEIAQPRDDLYRYSNAAVLEKDIDRAEVARERYRSVEQDSPSVADSLHESSDVLGLCFVTNRTRHRIELE